MMTAERSALIAELSQINNDFFPHQDIVTFTGFMDDVAVAKHVQRYRELAATKVSV